MVGKSTCGSGDTGSWKNAIAPARVMPKVSSVVATGRRMKDSDTLIAASSWAARSSRRALFAVPSLGFLVFTGEVPRQAIAQPREREIDHRRGEQCEHLADDEAADDGEAERVAQLRAGSRAEHQRQRAEQRRHRRHQDRA